MIGSSSGLDGLAFGPALAAGDLARIVRELNLNHAKWDTHVGGGCVLSAEPLLIRRDAWDRLCRDAEAAAGELPAIEREIAGNEKLQELIGVPRRLRGLLDWDERGRRVRVLRFDFHPTATGWVISEVNSDVPGGFGEASLVPRLYAPHTNAKPLQSEPLQRWADAVEEDLRGRAAALLCAPGFLEDEQVVRTLARELRGRGFDVYLIQSPFALRWKDGCACLRTDCSVTIDLLVRFYQAEWLSELPWWTGWKRAVRGSEYTVVANPATAVISESKRLALCLPLLSARSEAFQRLLPECCEPTEVASLPKDDWVLKAAYSNTGDEVHLGSELTNGEWIKLVAKATRKPRGWVAQRRFETLAFQSGAGIVKPCIGVFVIGGKAAGAYVRLSRTQVTDGDALEAPLFLMEEDR